MKYILLLLSLFPFYQTQAQTITYDFPNYNVNGKKTPKSEINSLLLSNEMSRSLYNESLAFKRKANTWGIVTGVFGVGTLIATRSLVDTSDELAFYGILIIGGGGLVLTTIPGIVTIHFSSKSANKYKRAIKIYNEKSDVEIGYIKQMSKVKFGLTANGVGFVCSF